MQFSHFKRLSISLISSYKTRDNNFWLNRWSTFITAETFWNIKKMERTRMTLNIFDRSRMFYNLNFLIETFMIKTLIEFCTWMVASRNPTARQNSYFLIMIYKIEGDLSCDGICMWFLDGSKFEPFSFSLISDRKLITCFELKKVSHLRILTRDRFL